MHCDIQAHLQQACDDATAEFSEAVAALTHQRIGKLSKVEYKERHARAVAARLRADNANTTLQIPRDEHRY